MVGEIRDNQTAQMALQAALTAHLLKATLVGVVVQRLVRTLCVGSSKVVTPNAPVWQKLVAPFVIPRAQIIYQPEGCRECRYTGYAGRQGIYEIMSIGGDLLAALRPDADMQHIRQLAVKQGMRSLRLAGANKVTQGTTSIEEVMRVTPQHIT